jgi:hypothetical protein
MRIRPIVFVLALTGATPALAQQGPPSSIGPNNLERNHSVVGTSDVANELPTAGAGVGIPNTAADVTRPSNLKKTELRKIQAMADARRAEAAALAERVKNGAQVPPALVAKVRAALEGDIELWRHGYQVDEKQWKAMRERWLRAPDTLTPAEWVLWRAAWFDQRDAWIAQTQSASRN